MSSNLGRSLIKAINNYSSPDKVAKTVVENICLSSYTLKSIRSLIIDPIKGKLVPSIKSTNSDNFEHILYALVMLPNSPILEDIMGFTEEKELASFINMYKTNPVYMWNYYVFYHTPDYLEETTFLYPYRGAFLYIIYKKDTTKNYTYLIEVYVVGPNAGNVYKQIKQSQDEIKDWMVEGFGKTRKNLIRVVSEGRRGLTSRTITVPKTIIVDHVINELNTVVNMVQKAEDINNKYEITKTTGVLLHGRRGTGKSTIVKWLAMTLERNLILATATNLPDVIDYIQTHHSGGKKWIILIEDIDLMFTDRRKTRVVHRRDEESGEIDNDMNMRTNQLFQILDGVLADSDLLVVATTNYFDRLDPALIRDGRFDHKIKIDGLDYASAEKVCERFEIDPSEIRLSEWRLPIIPATLQTVIMRYKVTGDMNYDPATAVEEETEEN